MQPYYEAKKDTNPGRHELHNVTTVCSALPENHAIFYQLSHEHSETLGRVLDNGFESETITPSNQVMCFLEENIHDFTRFSTRRFSKQTVIINTQRYIIVIHCVEMNAVYLNSHGISERIHKS